MPVRNVSNRGGNVIGRFPSLKMQRMIAFESLLERDLIYLLDYDTAVTWFEEQPLTIEYQHAGKLLHYTPDFHLVERDQHVLVECKPEHFVNTADNSRKFAAARAWCQACDWQFRIVTDADMRAGHRLQNIQLLTGYARHRIAPVLRCQLYAALQNVPTVTSIQALARALCPSDLAVVTSAILHLAYHGMVDLPLDDAPIAPTTVVALRRQRHPEAQR
jgi:hypothetical protein